MMVLIAKQGWEAKIVDVETVFLHGKLEEEIFMTIPKGYCEIIGNHEGKCLKLNRAIYGLVQAARQWWKRFKNEMVNIGFANSNIDPCLFIKQGGDVNVLSLLTLMTASYR